MRGLGDQVEQAAVGSPRPGPARQTSRQARTKASANPPTMCSDQKPDLNAPRGSQSAVCPMMTQRVAPRAAVIQ